MPAPEPLKLISQPVNSGRTSLPFTGRRSGASTRRELVTVTVQRRDYEKLKAAGDPDSDDIIIALRHYLDLIRETDWRPSEASFGWERGPVVHFFTAMPKDLADEIRNLPGRFDGHTIEAIRLFFDEEPDSPDGFSQQFDLAPTREESAYDYFGALRLLASRMFSYLLFP